VIAKKPHRHMIEISQRNPDDDDKFHVVRLELDDDAGEAIELFVKLKYATTGINHRGHANLFAVVALDSTNPDEREMHVILDQHSWERE
jgi:hypothetical protein